MDKKELYKKILQLDGLTNEEKSELLGLLRKQKKYGLVWEDKPEDVEERLREELPVLIEDTDKAIISEEADAPNHILIEGDNLEALTALAYTHEGKVDVIYIDPPYNTGNKDFVYNDQLVDKEDTYRHSKWLSFMSKRLRIAKQLLSEKGVIFISIDDNEQAQLKLLCDEIFGQENFLGLITRRQSSGAKNDTGENRVVTTADYLISYAKSDFSFNPYYVTNQKTYPREDNEGKFSPRALEMQGGGDTLTARPKMGYSVYYRQSDNSIKLLFDYNLKNNPVYEEPNTELISQGFECYRPRMRDMALGRWRWGDGTFIEKFNQNLVHFERGRVFIKERAKDNIPKYPEAIWEDYLNTQGTNELKGIFGGKSFSFPKPVSLIMQILRVAKASTVLDFFAGSGTTLHATMQLNAEDGGHRKCILVTNNENNICENVTYERNKRVINGYNTPKGEEVPGLTANSLRYYCTSFVGRERNMKNMRQLMNLSTDMLCIKEDLYTERPKFGEQRTFKNVFRYFDNGNRRMMIIYKEEAVSQLVELIRQTDYEGKMRIYVFSPSEDPWEGEFEEVMDKVQLCALPQAIYNAYRRILPKKKDETLVTSDEEVADTGNASSELMLNFTDEEAKA